MNKFITNSKTLLNALTIAAKAVVKNAVVPIIESYLFQVTGNRLTISGSDLQTTFKVCMGIENHEGSIFSMVVPPTIVKYLQKLGESAICIKWDNETYSLEILDEDSRAKYSGENAIDFPISPVCDQDLYNLTADNLKEFKDLLNYASGDDLRPAMTGIMFGDYRGSYNLVATDGHRMKVVTLSQSTEHETERQDFILPAKPAKILSDLKFKTDTDIRVKVKRVIDEVGKHSREYISNVSFSFPYQGFECELICRSIDEKFPAYYQVIPATNEKNTFYTTDKKTFLNILDKADLFAHKTTHQVRLCLNGVNKLSAEDLDFNNEFNGLIGGSYTGEPIEIGFNAVFLKEVVSSFGDTFTIEMSKPNKAAVIRQGNALALVMPVMLAQYEAPTAAKLASDLSEARRQAAN